MQIRMIHAAVIVVAALWLCGHAQAQQARGERMLIEVEASGDDTTGQRLAWAVRQKIAQSPLLLLWDGVSFGLDRVVMHLITLDTSRNGSATAYSVTWTFNDLYITLTDEIFLDAQVGVAGSERVYEVADGLVAKTYEISKGKLVVRGLADCMLRCTSKLKRPPPGATHWRP